MEFFETVKQTFKRMDERIASLEASSVKMEGHLAIMQAELANLHAEQGLTTIQLRGLREDVQGVGGAFTGIEAMLVTMLARIEALEKKAS